MLRKEYSLFLLLLTAIFTLAVLAYYPSITAPFYLDDQASIQNNALIKGEVSFHDLTVAYPFRQLTYASFAFNYYFFEGSLKSFHWFNIILHCFVGTALFLFVQKLLANSSFSKNRLPISVFIVGLFILAPINSQSVIYTVQRGTLFVTLFYLSGLYCYLQLRSVDYGLRAKSFFALLLLLCFVLGMLSKQNFATFPLACLLLELLVIKRVSPKLSKTIVAAGLTCFILLFFALWALQPELFARLDSFLTLTSVYSRWEYFTHQLVLVWGYTFKFVYPSPLLLEYSLTPYTWQDQQVWLAAAGHILVIIAALYCLKRRPLITFTIAFFYLTHSLESGFLAVLPDLGFEHRTYLPNVALAILVGLLFHALYDKSPRISLVIAMLVFILFSNVIHERSELWNHREAFYRHELKHTQDNPRPYAMVSQLFADDNRIEMATKWIKIAIQVGMEVGQLQGTLITQYMEILYRQGKPGEANAIGIKVIGLEPGNNAKAEILKTMAINRIESDNCDMALGLLNRALRYKPGDAELIRIRKLCAEL